jgi:hypothetical protein
MTGWSDGCCAIARTFMKRRQTEKRNLEEAIGSVSCLCIW